jgi:hypothetical protein
LTNPINDAKILDIIQPEPLQVFFQEEGVPNGWFITEVKTTNLPDPIFRQFIIYFKGEMD